MPLDFKVDCKVDNTRKWAQRRDEKPLKASQAYHYLSRPYPFLHSVSHPARGGEAQSRPSSSLLVQYILFASAARLCSMSVMTCGPLRVGFRSEVCVLRPVCCHEAAFRQSKNFRYSRCLRRKCWDVLCCFAIACRACCALMPPARTIHAAWAYDGGVAGTRQRPYASPYARPGGRLLILAKGECFTCNFACCARTESCHMFARRTVTTTLTICSCAALLRHRCPRRTF